MAILKIARIGHPVLTKTADVVVDPSAPEILNLIADMAETLNDAGGIGLAAPQVHQSKRIVLFRVPEGRTGEDGADEAVALTVMINPEVEPLDDEMEADWEGCLSLPRISMPAPCSTNATISTASFIPCA